MLCFLDENIPKPIGDILTNSGHTYLDPRGTELEGASDKILFEHAQNKNAIFITTDKDFYNTIPFLYKNHSGIVLQLLPFCLAPT